MSKCVPYLNSPLSACIRMYFLFIYLFIFYYTSNKRDNGGLALYQNSLWEKHTAKVVHLLYYSYVVRERAASKSRIFVVNDKSQLLFGESRIFRRGTSFLDGHTMRPITWADRLGSYHYVKGRGTHAP